MEVLTAVSIIDEAVQDGADVLHWRFAHRGCGASVWAGADDTGADDKEANLLRGPPNCLFVCLFGYERLGFDPIRSDNL